ncbi:MAG TPA: hypothetical protein VGO08_12765, partial [Burkholderiales bacterium]|nr:hypothetical protein [Burkholderiales bacterium]
FRSRPPGYAKFCDAPARQRSRTGRLARSVRGLRSVKAFFRDIAAFVVPVAVILVMNAHSLRPLRWAGWFVLVMAVVTVVIMPYSAWLRLTPAGREYDRSYDAGLRGAYGIYVRVVRRFGLGLMTPAIAVCWFTRTMNAFTLVFLGTLLAVYLYAVFTDRSHKRMLA